MKTKATPKKCYKEATGKPKENYWKAEGKLKESGKKQKNNEDDDNDDETKTSSLRGPLHREANLNRPTKGGGTTSEVGP